MIQIVQKAAVVALEKFGVADWNRILSILNAAYINHYYAINQSFLAYFLSDANEKTLTLIKWLGLPKEYPDIKKFKHAQAVKTLQVFQQA